MAEFFVFIGSNIPRNANLRFQISEYVGKREEIVELCTFEDCIYNIEDIYLPADNR